MNLDHVVLGAILAKPSLLKEVFGFVDQDLEAALNAVQQGKKEGLQQWLRMRGIHSGEELLQAVILSHEREVVESRMKKVSHKIHAATTFRATGRLAELNEELKGLLEQHEANAVKTKSGTQAKNSTQADSSQKGVQETKGAGMSVGTGQVQGSKSGVRVSGTDRSTGGPLPTTRPTSHRKSQVGQN